MTVYVDQALGDPGMQNAQSLLSSADSVVSQNNAIFGITGGSVSVIVYAMGGSTDGTGGADHGGCDFTVGNAIEVDAAFGSPNRIIGLFEAELSECAMNGSLCGFSTGEALSRWCAAVAQPRRALRLRHRSGMGSGRDARLGQPDRADRR